MKWLVTIKNLVTGNSLLWPIDAVDEHHAKHSAQEEAWDDGFEDMVAVSAELEEM